MTVKLPLMRGACLTCIGLNEHCMQFYANFARSGGQHNLHSKAIGMSWQCPSSAACVIFVLTVSVLLPWSAGGCRGPQRIVLNKALVTSALRGQCSLCHLQQGQYQQHRVGQREKQAVQNL